MELARVESEGDREALRSLLVEFHDWMVEHAGDVYDAGAELEDDLTALAEEPACWAWLGRLDGTPSGCVLLFGPTDALAEFRRLWVTPSVRGAGLGRALVQQVIHEAGARGYETLALTTPPWAEASHRLYESLGFERTGPYPETRLPEQHHDDAIFMQLDLTAAEAGRATE